jgi:hypothetical protein
LAVAVSGVAESDPVARTRTRLKHVAKIEIARIIVVFSWAVCVGVI